MKRRAVLYCTAFFMVCRITRYFMTQIELILLLVAAIIILQVIALLWGRRTDVASQLAQLQTDLQQHQQQISERSERELRAQVQTTAQSTRQELTGHFAQMQQTLAAQLESMRQAIMLLSL